MAGTLAGAGAWFANPASQVSAHYGIGLDGRMHQYVQLDDTAWANGILEAGHRWGEVLGAAGVEDRGRNPNRLTVSVETEDLGSARTEVTDAQYAAVLGVCRLALAAHPSIRVVTGHHVVSPSSRSSCPGNRWVVSGRLAALAGTLGLKLVA